MFKSKKRKERNSSDSKLDNWFGYLNHDKCLLLPTTSSGPMRYLKTKRRFQMQDIPMYNLADLLESDIKGNFYQAELQTVDKSEDTLWNVEKIIHKRRRNNRTEVLVKWTGYSDRFNSWVDEADVKNMWEPQMVNMSASFYLVVDSDNSKNLECYLDNKLWKF